MIVAIEFLIMVLIIASCITIKFKLKQENSILITFLSSVLLIYFLGLFDKMLISLYFLGVLDLLGVIYIIYSIIKKNVKLKEIFTLGTIIYIFVSVMLGILLKNTFFTDWDEFSHWGPNLKAMVANDLFWSNNKWDGIHVAYQPLAGLIEWWFCKLNGGFSESVAYLAMDIGIITLILPIFKNLKFKLQDIIKSILFLVCFLCFIYIFSFTLTSIYIDLILGVMFASGMYVAMIANSKEDNILIALILISMAELKTTGLLLAGIILIVLFLRKVLLPAIKEKKLGKIQWKNILILILMLVSILVAYKSWDMYCKSNNRVLDRRHDNNFISEINIKEFVKAVIQYHCTDEKLNSISRSFYNALNEKEIVHRLPCRTIVQILVVLDFVMIYAFVKERDKERRWQILIQGISFNVGFVLYCLLLMGTYMFAFTEVEGRGLFSLDRYMSTYFIAWIINIIAMFMSKKSYYEIEDSRNITRNPSISALVIILLVGIYGSNIQNLVKPIEKNNSTIPAYIQEKANIVNSTLNSNDKVYVIFQDPGVTVDPFVFRYCISPIVMNLMDEYSLGELDGPNDTMTYNITADEWKEKLINENYDYVFILKTDDEFNETYKGLFEKETDFQNIENKIFKVNKTRNNDVELTLYTK